MPMRLVVLWAGWVIQTGGSVCNERAGHCPERADVSCDMDMETV